MSWLCRIIGHAWVVKFPAYLGRYARYRCRRCRTTALSVAVRTPTGTRISCPPRWL